MKIIMMILLTTVANASTFVGNGGGQGDIEIAAAKKQMAETFTAIIEKKTDQYLCTCRGDYENRSVCEPLRKLSDSQKQFCQKTLFEKAPELLGFVQSSKVKLSWTYDKIEVTEGKHLRAVDAVTDPEKNEITLNLPRFLEMTTFERVFLLSHEYMHLTKINGKPLTDNEAVGPFEGEEGGREFLNATGSAVSVLEGELPGISNHKAMIMRSRAGKDFWVDLGLGSSSTDKAPSSSFGSRTTEDSQLSFRYFFGNLGLVTRMRREFSHKKILSSDVTVDEETLIGSLGIAYRIFPFEDPLTYWGQSHLLLQAQYDFVNAKISAKDSFVNYDETAKASGLSGSVSYYFPFFWGLWGYGGVGYESHPYKYSGVNLNYKGGKTTALIGVAYGF